MPRCRFGARRRPARRSRWSLPGKGKRPRLIRRAAGGCQFDPLKASAEGRVLKVTEGGVALERGDVLVGEVWLCSGQSNMGMPVQESANAAAEIAAAEHPRLRLFTVARHPSLDPLEEMAGQWAPCTPETVAGFSATAYYFGRRLQAELGVPIGLIHSSFGGSPAEAWTRLEVLQSIPTLGTARRLSALG